MNITYPGTRKEMLPTLVRFIRPVPGMNFVAYCRLDEHMVDATIEEQKQIDFFSPMTQPFSWHVCSHDLPSRLTERLVAHNFKRDDPTRLWC